MKREIAGLILIVLLSTSCSNLNVINFKRVEKSMIQKEITMLPLNEKAEKEILSSSPVDEQYENEETLLISESSSDEVNKTEVRNNKWNDASNVIKSIKPLKIHAIHKISVQKNISENEKEMMVFNGDEASIIRLLIGLFVIGIVICFYLAWETGGMISIYFLFFFVACILALLIYAAVIGVLRDVLMIGGPLFLR